MSISVIVFKPIKPITDIDKIINNCERSEHPPLWGDRQEEQGQTFRTPPKKGKTFIHPISRSIPHVSPRKIEDL
jgi:hypothetical protein